MIADTSKTRTTLVQAMPEKQSEIKAIDEIMVFVEPNCLACERVLQTIRTLQKNALVERLEIINRYEDPAMCERFGIVIYPATFIYGKLAYYGEFSVDDVKEYLHGKII